MDQEEIARKIKRANELAERLSGKLGAVPQAPPQQAPPPPPPLPPPPPPPPPPAFIGSSALFALYAALLAALYRAFNDEVREPYMDEPFHVRQTQSYCAGNWTEWDEKITTFPGLYAATALLVRGWAPGCELPLLRTVNLIPALATPPLLLAQLRLLYPSLSTTDALANSAVLSLLPTHFFFHFLYYTDSAATASVLLFLVLLSQQVASAGAPPERKRSIGSFGSSGGGGGLLLRLATGPLGVGGAAALALSIRQTNAVWLMHGVISASLTQLADGRSIDPAETRLLPASGALLLALPRKLPHLCARHLPVLSLLSGFAAFVVRNGGVVVGDAAHHRPTLHGAQLLYLTGLASAPFCAERLTASLLPTLRGAAAAARAAPALALGSACLAAACARLTHCHPFLLADNRHVTFYVWRHVLGRHWAARYALLPAYLLGGWLLYPPLWRTHGALRALFLCCCAALVLVPTPLIEPRYLTLPVLLLRLHAPPLRRPREWLPPLLLFAAVNAAAIGLFLYRPYQWVDGSVARFMW